MDMGLSAVRKLTNLDAHVASLALALMMVIPLIEIFMRPFLGSGIENAPVLVQHLGLLLAMFGALVAERHGHLTSLGSSGTGATPTLAWRSAQCLAAVVCGVLAYASFRFVQSEREASHLLAYGLPTWTVQSALPLCFSLLGFKLGRRAGTSVFASLALSLLAPLAGFLIAWQLDGMSVTVWPALALVGIALVAGAPIFAVLGGLALALFWSEGMPLASVALSHYQITVNPSLPALPLFTFAGLLFARTGAARRLGDLFVVLMGGGVHGTVVAVAVLCSFFTAFTGGSGVTILALGGLMLPLLRNAAYPEDKGIGLVTSASALGVLLAPSVPLIMYAIIARVPIATMFLAGVVPALVMVACLLFFGGFLKAGSGPRPATEPLVQPSLAHVAWKAKWEILAPFVAIGSLASGVATPMESAALTAGYAVLTQALAHRELPMRLLLKCLSESAQIIGGVLLILGMALALTNFLIDAGIPDAAIEAVQSLIPNRWIFLVALTVFLLLAGALMEIFAAIVVLVPLLLPVAQSYGIGPVHFGIIFLAAMEMGFLCPPAGLNIFFASAMFGKPIRAVAASVMPALAAIFLGTLFIAWLPELSTALPSLLGGSVPAQ
ncbi:MAG: TRAP transporter large permease subunit [Rhodoferax sp.]|nr:TRAP transporter large permease subunit [Rhodoferax sp.]